MVALSSGSLSFKAKYAVASFTVTLASFKAILAMARLPPDLARGITLQLTENEPIKFNRSVPGINIEIYKIACHCNCRIIVGQKVKRQKFRGNTILCPCGLNWLHNILRNPLQRLRPAFGY